MYPVVYATQTQFSVLLTISHSKVNVTFIMQKHCRTERGFVEIMQLNSSILFHRNSSKSEERHI